MTELQLFLSAEDMDRLFAIKELQGRDDLAADDFARELLEEYLYKLYPARPKWDDEGHLANAESYRGPKA